MLTDRNLLNIHGRGGNPPEKIHPKLKKSSEQAFLNNFRQAPDLCHREEGTSLRELLKKVQVNAELFSYSGILSAFVYFGAS